MTGNGQHETKEITLEELQELADDVVDVALPRLIDDYRQMRAFLDDIVAGKYATAKGVRRYAADLAEQLHVKLTP